MNDHLRFGYRHSQPIWTARTKDGIIVVDERTYDHILREKLAMEGMTWKSWQQYMRPGEEAWRRQCEAEHRLQCDMRLWQSVPGVEIHPLKRTQELES